jgi:hypothetical protein
VILSKKNELLSIPFETYSDFKILIEVLTQGSRLFFLIIVRVDERYIKDFI